MRFTLSLVVALSALASAQKPAAPGAGKPEPARPAPELTVHTKEGCVIGHYARNDTTVREFLGIPYAKPPVGPLRWAPPAKATPWKKPLVAAKFGPGCWNIATEGLISRPLPLVEDEDCLSVNVWAPSKARMKGKKAAVMLWVHGGGFAWGSSDDLMYYGGNIVRDQQDVVVVTINYRLNVFGFPGAPGLADGKLNPGLLDVRAAIEWTKANIASFGGDPKKIFLFGESAGGAAVSSYLYFGATYKDPIINAAAMQSGVLTLSGTPAGGPNTALWSKLSTLASCPVTPVEENLKCLRAVPAKQLIAISKNNTLAYRPVADNGTIFTDTNARLADGRFIRVPVIVGSNDDEIPGQPLVTDLSFTCPAAKVAQGLGKFTPAYQYRFFGDFPTLPGQSLGAFHGTEISQIFGTFRKEFEVEEQVKNSKFIQKVWADFAKDPKGGLQKVGWPTIDYEKETLAGLAYENMETFKLLDPKAYTKSCPP